MVMLHITLWARMCSSLIRSFRETVRFIKVKENRQSLIRRNIYVKEPSISDECKTAVFPVEYL